MAECDTRATVHELYDAYERRDFERVAALIHDDVDWVIYAPISVFPFAGPRRGRKAVMMALAGSAEAYVLLNYTREIVVVEGNRATVMTNASYRQRSTGRTLRFRIASFLRFADGGAGRVPRIYRHLRPGRTGARPRAFAPALAGMRLKGPFTAQELFQKPGSTFRDHALALAP